MASFHLNEMTCFVWNDIVLFIDIKKKEWNNTVLMVLCTIFFPCTGFTGGEDGFSSLLYSMLQLPLSLLHVSIPRHNSHPSYGLLERSREIGLLSGLQAAVKWPPSHPTLRCALDKNRVVSSRSLLPLYINTPPHQGGGERTKKKEKEKRRKKQKRKEKREQKKLKRKKRKQKPLALPREEQCPPTSYKTSFSPSLFWQRQTPFNDRRY